MNITDFSYDEFLNGNLGSHITAHYKTLYLQGDISTIPNALYLGQMVWLKTDVEQRQRMIIGILENINGSKEYKLACGDNQTWHFSNEISLEKDVIKTF